MRYRKRPVQIEAIQYDGTNADEIIEWSGARWIDVVTDERDPDDPNNFLREPALVIGTLEGDMHVSAGDFVIRGVQNEYYPCKESIFRETYESVES